MPTSVQGPERASSLSRIGLGFGLAFLVACLVLGPHATREATTMDYYWLLAEGERIATQGLGSASAGAPFVFTAPATSAFFDKEWLFAWMLFILHSHLGYAATVVARAALIFGITGGFFAVSRRLGAAALPTLVIFLAGATSIGIQRLALRPHLVGYLFLLCVYFIVLAPRGGRQLVALYLIGLLWVNIHGSFALGLAILFAAAIAQLVQASRRGTGARRRELRALAMLAPLPLLVLLNPYGLSIVRAFITAADAATSFDPIVTPEWKAFALRSPTGFFHVTLLTLTVLTALLPSTVRRLDRFVLIALGAVPALTLSRFTVDSFLILGPLLASQISSIDKRFLRHLATACLGCLALVFSALMLAGSPPWRFRPDPRDNPADVLAVLDQAPTLEANLFAEPAPAVFALSTYWRRLKVAYDAHLIQPKFSEWALEFSRASSDPAAFDAYCARHHCQLVLVDLADRRAMRRAMALFGSDAYRRVSFDLRWNLYAEKSYSDAHPELKPYELLNTSYVFDDIPPDPAAAPEIEDELKRLAQQPGGAKTAAVLRAYLDLRALQVFGKRPCILEDVGEKQRAANAAETLRDALRDYGFHPGLRFYYGAALATLGDPSHAVLHLRQAADFNPRWVAPRLQLIALCARTGENAAATALLRELRSVSPDAASFAEHELLDGPGAARRCDPSP